VSVDGQYLAKLQDYYAKHRVLPSYAALGKLVGLRSKGSVAELVQRLKAEGFLKSSPDRRLRPSERFFQRSVAESIRAGIPTQVAEVTTDLIGIDDYLVRHPSRTIFIRVKGDSMIDAGIHADDIVVVERKSEAEVGDIVVAIVENEFTLKYLARERDHFVLRPANRAFPVIRPRGSLEIFGVVVGQFRKY
jgi:SOS regulatory protein LexA